MSVNRSATMWVRAVTICALAWAGTGSLAPAGVATAAASVGPASEATQADPCFNLDLVFIIDQSGSMSAQGSANDPNKQRIKAAVEMSRVLSDISLDECPGALHRMAVVSFGTKANLDLKLTKIEPDTLPIVAENIEKANPDMGQTDPKKGFELARDELKDAASDGDRPRKRVIVFLTDGEPCVTALGCTTTNSTMQPLAYVKELQAFLAKELPFDPKLWAQDDCIAGLVQKYGDRDKVPGTEANACFTKFKINDIEAYPGSTYIFTILLSASGRYTQSVVDVMEQISTEHRGKLYRLEQNARDIPVMLRKIVSELAGVRVTSLQCDNFAVNPYLKKLTLAISRISTDLAVTISYTDAEGKHHSIVKNDQGPNGGFDPPANGSMYRQDGVNERYVFDNPYPGIWSLSADNCEGFRAFYDPKGLSVRSSGEVANQVRLLQVEQAPHTDRAKPFKLAYTMLDEANQPVAQAVPPRFAVDFKLVVKQPNGVEATYKMVYLPDTKQFQTVKPVQLPEAGMYTVEYTGTTHYRAELFSLGQMSEIELAFPDRLELFTGSGKFEVTAVRSFSVEIDKLNSNKHFPVHLPIDFTQPPLWPLRISTFTLKAKLVGNGYKLPDLSEVLETSGEPETFDNVLSVRVGAREAVPMQRVDGTAEFEATIAGYDTVGSSPVKVEFTGKAKEEFRATVTTASGVIEREDPDLWSKKSTYQAIVWVLIALVLAWLGRVIWGRMDPVRGRLVFGVGADVLQEYSLYTGKRSSRLKLHGSPELMLRYVRVNYQGQTRARQNIQYGEQQPERGVRLKVANLQGQIVRIELSPGQEVRYLEQFPKKRVGYFAARAQAAPRAAGDEVADYAAGDDVSQVFMRFETDAA